MIRFISLLYVGIMAFTALPQPAFAKEPTASVKSLYAEYKLAMARKNYTNAFFLAGKTWKQSEQTFGASKQTGDFAYNYAVLGRMVNSEKRDKQIKKAFARSIELASLHGEKSDAVAMKRYLNYGAYLMQIDQHKKAAAMLTKSEALAHSLGITDTKDYANLMYHQAGIALKAKHYSEAKPYIEKALQAYNRAQLGTSRSASKAIYLQARIDEKNGDWQNALLGYEKTYVNNGHILNQKDKVIGRAYLQHRQLRFRIMEEKDMSSEDMRVYSSCLGCWPNILPKYKLQAQRAEAKAAYRNERQPPIMPRYARSSAFLAIQYDIDETGVPTNLRIIGGSHAKTFDAATYKSMKTWRAYEAKSGELVTNKKDWVALMNFRLNTRKGVLLDFHGIPLED